MLGLAVPPALHRRLVPLRGAGHRPLDAPTHRPQQPTDVGRVVPHAVRDLDDRRHPPRCPHVAAEAERLRPTRQQRGQCAALRFRQLGRRPRGDPAPQRLDATGAAPGEPLAHRPRRDAERVRDLVARPARLVQRPRAQPPSFAPVLRGRHPVLPLVQHTPTAAPSAPPLVTYAQVSRSCHEPWLMRRRARWASRPFGNALTRSPGPMTRLAPNPESPFAVPRRVSQVAVPLGRAARRGCVRRSRIGERIQEGEERLVALGVDQLPRRPPHGGVLSSQ
jgi:hypothetical protein